MREFSRICEVSLSEKLNFPRVHILFGARQTGKSTLVQRLLPEDAIVFNMADPVERSRFQERPGDLAALCRALKRRDRPWFIFIDEAQLVPELFNMIQVLYDEDHDRWRFLLCGSSARRLRATGANLLPGRSILHSLFPLTNPEYGHPALIGLPASAMFGGESLFPPLRNPVKSGEPEGALSSADNPPRREESSEAFPYRELEDRLLFGDLPGIALIESKSERREVLKTYVAVHLEEELRRESTLRDFGTFLRFLRFAATESGGILNLRAIAKESGLTGPTIRSHYRVLEDMFLGFMIPAFSGSTRKSSLSSPRFYFFDLGIRNAAAGFDLEMDAVRANPGPLFEHWVGGELYKRLRYRGSGTLSYLRTSGGMEIDFIVEDGDELFPVEVKWTERPSLSDARHLLTFLKDHPDRAKNGYIVCRCPWPLALSDTITAIPWWGL